MRKLLLCVVLAALSGLPAMANLIVIADGQVTVNLYADVSAAAGADFYWRFSVKNETSYYFVPTSLDTDFLGGSVSPDLADFNAAYPGDGVGPGEESSTYKIAYYSIPLGASGVFGPGTVILYFELYGNDPFYYESGQAEFPSESVTVTGGPPEVPEPSSLLLCLGGVAAIARKVRRQRSERSEG
jgi:hypothetical protein